MSCAPIYKPISSKRYAINCEQTIFGKRKYSDAEYETALITAYTQLSADKWHKYMQIVRKMHYSMEDISVEEMEYCYGCYKKVMSK